MARLRATVVSQAPGRRGIPSAGQRCDAVAKASCAQSSARSQSPDCRIERGNDAAPLVAEGGDECCLDVRRHISQIGLTSIEPVAAPGIRAATSIAASRSSHSTTK